MQRFPSLPTLALCLFMMFSLSVFADDQKEDQQNVEATAPSVADLGWIAGDWVGDMQGSTIEEIWSAPGADTLMGMFRWHDGENVRLYEFMSIEKGESGPVLYLRHFSRALVAWEKDGPLVLAYDGSAAGQVSFLSDVTDAEGKRDITRLTYTRQGDELTVTLLKSDGRKEKESVFKYRAR